MIHKALVIMTRLRQMDDLFLTAQRQGRISFYLSCRREEEVRVGAASALITSYDPILAQYREQGVLMWRGFTLEQFANQCFSNDLDLGKGRQMPVVSLLLILEFFLSSTLHPTSNFTNRNSTCKP